jgi:hypothetical protein
MAKMNRLERLGTLEDIAAVAFLVGPDGSWINARSCAPTAGWSEQSPAFTRLNLNPIGAF